MTSLLRRFRLGKWKHFVGSDLQGNLYFERPDPNQPYTFRRTVVPKNVGSRQPSHYVSSDVPPLWSAWMRRTRADPPTMEELQRDAQRRVDLQENVARLDVEYRAERLRMAAKREGQAAADSIGPASQSDRTAETAVSPPARPDGLSEAHVERQRARRHMQRSPLEDYRPAAAGGATEEPQAWVPATVRR